MRTPIRSVALAMAVLAVAAACSRPTSEPDAATADAATGDQLWILPAGIAGFHERWSDDADAQIALRTKYAKEGIPLTLAAIKKTAEA